jgi:excisionase family DNA binding protein
MAVSTAKSAEYITVFEIAERLQTSVNTVRRWVTMGWLPAPIRLGPSGRWVRWRRSIIDAFLAELEGRRDD